LEKNLDDLGSAKDWQIEYKWDGIRGQLIKRNNEIFIWSRGEELVTPQFPKLKKNFLPGKEILYWMVRFSHKRQYRSQF
jgi:ATP-dependent DNA ligase